MCQKIPEVVKKKKITIMYLIKKMCMVFMFRMECYDIGSYYFEVPCFSRLGFLKAEYVCFYFHFHALEKEMATHFNALAWRIPGTEVPGGLLSMRSHRVGHD